MFGWKKKGRKTAPPMAVYAGPEYFERRSKKNGEERMSPGKAAAKSLPKKNGSLGKNIPMSERTKASVTTFTEDRI